MTIEIFYNNQLTISKLGCNFTRKPLIILASQKTLWGLIFIDMPKGWNLFVILVGTITMIHGVSVERHAMIQLFLWHKSRILSWSWPLNMSIIIKDLCSLERFCSLFTSSEYGKIMFSKNWTDFAELRENVHAPTKNLKIGWTILPQKNYPPPVQVALGWSY